MTVKTVAVLFGGVSPEHTTSCKSTVTLLRALREAGLTVYPIGISKEGVFLPWLLADEQILNPNWADLARQALEEKGWMLQLSGGFDPRELMVQLCGGVLPDVILLGLHGVNGEDGRLQGFLELTKIPYTGCRVLASALGMNKVKAKQMWSAAGLPVVPYAVVTRERLRTETDQEEVLDSLIEGLSLPLFLKPSEGGSSVGTYLAKTREELRSGLLEVAQFDTEVLVESFLSVRELEVAVLGNEEPEVASVGEVVVNQDEAEYYDYETKYLSETGSRVQVPATLEAEKMETLRTLARQAYQVLGCRGYARVDFFLDKETGRVYLNEINTLPGFTQISLFPRAWAAAGIDTPALVQKICTLACEEWVASERVETVEY